MSGFQKDFLQRALDLATQNARSGSGGPFAALVVKDGQVIGEGTNSVTATNDPSAHAEIVAIREACRRLGSFELRDCDIYTSCEPCPMCLGAIYWSRPRAVYFAAGQADAAKAGFDDAFIYDEINRDFAARQIPFYQSSDMAAFRPFAEWIKNPNKVPY